MNLKETLTNEEWAWINKLAQHSNYAIGDSRKTKIVHDWAAE